MQRNYEKHQLQTDSLPQLEKKKTTETTPKVKHCAGHVAESPASCRFLAPRLAQQRKDWASIIHLETKTAVELTTYHQQNKLSRDLRTPTTEN